MDNYLPADERVRWRILKGGGRVGTHRLLSGRGGDPVVTEELPIADQHLAVAHGRFDAMTGGVLEIVGIDHVDAAVFGSIDERPGEGVFAPTLDDSCELQHVVLAESLSSSQLPTIGSRTPAAGVSKITVAGWPRD